MNKKQIFCLFYAFNHFSEKFYQNPVHFFSVIPRGVPLPHSNAITILRQAREKVNDVIFPSGCEARAINLSNKNVKIGIFTGGTRLDRKILVFSPIFFDILPESMT